MIQALVASALQHQVPFSFLLGHLEPGASASAARQDWKMTELKVDWRPAGVSEFFLARLVAPEPLPTFDQAEIASGMNSGRGGKPRRAFTQGNQHRIVLRVPQSTPYVAEDYRRDKEAAVQALNLFERIAAEQRLVRLMGIPSVYAVSGGAGTSEQAPSYTTQHFPIALEDAQTGDILWVHPEAEHLVQGGRLGGGRMSVAPVQASPSNPAASQGTRILSSHELAAAMSFPGGKSAVAMPTDSKPATNMQTGIKSQAPAGPAWYVGLKTQAQELGIPEDLQRTAIVKLRAGELAAAAGAPDRKNDFMAQAEAEVKAAESGPVARPAWFTTLEAEVTELGVPQERQSVAIARMRARQLEAEKQLTPDAALQTATREVEDILRGARAVPGWVTEGLAEAEELGIPATKHVAFLMNQRALQLGGTPEAKEQARQEVEEALRNLPPAEPAAAHQAQRQERTARPAAKPAAATGTEQHASKPRIQIGEEIQVLQKFVNDNLVTKRQIADLTGKDPSWVSRLLTGARGATGLQEEIHNQIVAINMALTEGTALPEPLPKSNRHRRTAGGTASAMPEGSDGNLETVEV